MSKYTYCVITKVPDPEKGEPGNLATAFPLYQATSLNPDYTRNVELFDPMTAMQLLREVFTVSEILILDQNGRELVGAGRKPSKWYVETEEFDNIDDAIARAQQVMAAEVDGE